MTSAVGIGAKEKRPESGGNRPADAENDAEPEYEGDPAIAVGKLRLVNAKAHGT